MESYCPRFCSEFNRPMFSIDERPHGKLDLKETFQMGKELRSAVGTFKFVSLLTTLASLAHVWAVHPVPMFLLAYLTIWGAFFSICYLLGSLLLTICSPSSLANTQPNRLVKFTWMLYSVSSTLECFTTVLYWAGRPADMGPITLGDVTMHCVVLAILLVQGFLVDRIPLRLKHTGPTILVSLFYTAWLVLQNVVFQYNPEDDDDDDAIYDAIRWREDTILALILSLVALVSLLFFAILLWALSLPGRRYSSDDGLEEDKPDETGSTEVFDEQYGETGSEVDMEVCEVYEV
mmetsp:Transcript_32507/g.78903  ORF Transcript_32507/g.78903 Transcript_32507/m.78903 type:complete len:291 (+) Transcript_32507:193-1065(+)